MKKNSREARCTSENGKERSREIREPFGSGMDKYREAEAIRQNPPRPFRRLSVHFPRAQEVQPELRATNQQFQCTVALRSGQAQRSTGSISIDARWYWFVVRYRKLSSVNMSFLGGARRHTGILSREYAIVPVHSSS